MRKFTSYMITMLLASIFSVSAFAQNVTISGNVKNSSSAEDAAAVSVTIKGTDVGTFTDEKGNFSISTKSLPATLVFSSVGFTTQEVSVTSATQQVSVNFVPSEALGQEVVVSATRVAQKIMESPVSIERVSAAGIRNSGAANFYDVVLNLKGVDVTTSSLTFKTPTTRGFNGSGNARFNQLVDGMDNTAPGLNFSVGAIIGLSELDVDNIELLPGASSVLYGSGGMNGTLLMTSKNPFKYQGFSYLIKTGIMHTDEKQRPTSPFYNWNFRYAKKVSEKFAFKINTELTQAKDWLAPDERNYSRLGTTGNIIAGNRQSDPNYDGVNVYGDETSVDIRGFINAFAAATGNSNQIANFNIPASLPVSRTGYTERETLNPNTVNYKVSGSFHYKISENTEAVIAGYWGTGNTIYTGSDRYSLKSFKMGQYKVELNNKNWSLRAYTTQENSGESFNATATTRIFNESWKTSVTRNPVTGAPTPQLSDWYVQYASQYFSNRLSGATNHDAHQQARAFADIGRPAAGSASFKNGFDAVRKRPISQRGGLLLDKSDLYNVEGNYNLTSVTKDFADVLIGVNYKKFVLNSQGTLFADTAGPIGISEYGGYIQASRKVTDRVTLTASGRYDKNENFKGRFTPRFTALIKVVENNNLRLSYQTAYRFPTNQQQFINLEVGSTRLIGGDPSFATAYNFAAKPLFTAASIQAGSPKIFVPPVLKPEAVTTFEIGYKGLLFEDKLLIDAYTYFGEYQDFLGRINTVQVGGAGSLSVPFNSSTKVKTNGFAVSLDYRLPANFTIGGNLSSDILKNVPSDFVAFFNAPKYKTNFTIGNNGFGPDKRLSANISYRWQDGFFYQGDFANGELPDVHNVDAQISLKLPKSKSIFKIGASNLLNQYYYNAIGNAQVGGLYYVSYGFNVY